MAVSKSISVTVTDNAAATGEVQLITLGEEPEVRACIFSGGTAVPVKFLHSDPESDAAAALGNLLKKTEKMLATHLIPGSKASSKCSKVAGRVSITTASPVTKVPVANADVSSAVKKGPVSQIKAFSKTSKVKVDSKVQANTAVKVKHERAQSDTGFWDSCAINNGSFQVDNGEGQNDGYDSGFDSRDGEPHPQRSYMAALAKADAAAAAKGVVPAQDLGSWF
jgi:hypothetical protein